MTPREEAVFGTLEKLRGCDRWVLTSKFAPNTASGRLNFKRWCAEQERRGLLWLDEIHARTIRSVELVCRRSIGDDAPDFSALAAESRRRWESLPVAPVTVVRATTRLRNILGASHAIRFKSMAQCGHDLGVACLFFHLQGRARWMGEDELAEPAFQEAQPDAVLLTSDGEVDTALEFASHYSPDKFAKLERTFGARNTPYEVWMPAYAR